MQEIEPRYRSYSNMKATEDERAFLPSLAMKTSNLDVKTNGRQGMDTENRLLIDLGIQADVHAVGQERIIVAPLDRRPVQTHLSNFTKAGRCQYSAQVGRAGRTERHTALACCCEQASVNVLTFNTQVSSN